MAKAKTSKRTAAAPKAPARADRQSDDEYCTCCVELCDCGDCEECKADTQKVLPVKDRWTKP
ncbi:MAG: hypothetical protein HYT80_05120 [Euryarchaeota archaeon]|nr:hypothetical protein [Euryarchaeota archaeon]